MKTLQQQFNKDHLFLLFAREPPNEKKNLFLINTKLFNNYASAYTYVTRPWSTIEAKFFLIPESNYSNLTKEVMKLPNKNYYGPFSCTAG